MEKGFDIPRTIRRMAPKHAAPAGVFRNSQQLAFGIVTNISVTGACIAVASLLAPGRTCRRRWYKAERPCRCIRSP